MKHRPIRFGGWRAMALLGLWCGSVVLAQQPPATDPELEALRQEIEAAKKTQAEMRQQIQEIKRLAQAQAAPARPSAIGKVVSVEGAMSRGEKLAKVTILELSDYQCPFCGVFATQTMPQIFKEYVETGKVKYVFRDYPLVRMHKQALRAAEASRCAADQGKYWEMHAVLFSNTTALAETDLSRYAQTVGLDLPVFQHCLTNGQHLAAIKQDMIYGDRVGVSATPFFLIGLTEPDGSGMKVTTAFGGLRSFEVFQQMINELLESKPPAR